MTQDENPNALPYDELKREYDLLKLNIRSLCSSIAFSLTPEQIEQVQQFKAKVETERGSDYAGSIGGATTYQFTPTSLGAIIKVTHFGQTLDLTDYQSW